MIKKLTNNLGWKILSLLLAFLLWLTVINAEDPQVSTTIRGIPVEKLNESAITSQKRAIQYVAGDTVDVKVKGKRSLVYKLTANNIRAYADMKNLSITDAADIQLDLPNEIELISKSPSSVLVKLEKIIRKQLEVQYEKQGKTKSGFVDLNPTITPSVIELEAAESTIYKVEKVVVPVNIDGISGDFTISVAPQVFDYSGALVSGITTSANQIQVKVPVEKTRTIPLNFQVKGKPGEEYVYLGATLSSNEIQVRGKQNLIDKLQDLVIDNVDISEMNTKQTVTVNLAKLLPDGISLNQDHSTIEVEIDIEPIISREFEFTAEDIEIKDKTDKQQVLILNEEPIVVTYKGIESVIKEVTKEQIKPFLSVSDRKNGTHSITVEWDGPENLERVSPEVQVTVEISTLEVADASAVN